MDPWLYVTTAFSAITMLLSLLLFWRTPGAALSTEELDKLSRSLGSIRNALDFAPADEVRPGGARSGSRGAAARSGRQERPRENRPEIEPDQRTRLAERIRAFHEHLREWCRINDIEPRSVLSETEKLNRWIGELGERVAPSKLGQIARDFQVIAENAAKAALLSSDRTYDREKNGPGQSDLGALIDLADGKVIAPTVGQPVDSLRHSVLDARPAHPPYSRGTIAKVATRGLERKDGKVIALAEVYEYD